MYRMSSFVFFVQLGAIITCHAVICAFTWKFLQVIWTSVLVRALWLTREIVHQCLTWKNCNSKIIHCLLSYNGDVKFYSVFAVLCFGICFYILDSFALMEYEDIILQCVTWLVDSSCFWSEISAGGSMILSAIHTALGVH